MEIRFAKPFVQWLVLLGSIAGILLAGCSPSGGQSRLANAANSESWPEGKGSTRDRVELVVFAAASLTESFTEIGRLFEQENPTVKVIFSFEGSQRVRSQIEQGARADIFASADLKEMEKARSGGLVEESHIFARNKLMIVLPRDNPAGIATLQDLAHPGLKLALANRSVPIGSYSLAALDKMSREAGFSPAFKSQVLANVVSEESQVKAVITKAVLGEVDAGIVYATDINSKTMPDLKTVAIPSQLNVVADYPIAQVKDSRKKDTAGSFISFVLSDKGRRVLSEHGFILEDMPIK